MSLSEETHDERVARVTAEIHAARKLERLEYHRTWRAKNPDKVKSSGRRAYTHKYNREWYQRNREKVIAKSAEWYANNFDRYKSTQYLKKYGITLDQANAMLAAQGNVCAICRTDDATRGRWCVEHCHDSGRIGGIVHAKCNSGIALLGEDPVILRLAADYLEARRGK